MLGVDVCVVVVVVDCVDCDCYGFCCCDFVGCYVGVGC